MAVDWRDRLGEALRVRFPDHDALYHVGLRPLGPPDWVFPDMAALTFRVGRRSDGAPSSLTTIHLPGVRRLGERLGLSFESTLAMVDNHERTHIQLQLEGVDVEEEEQLTHVADVALLWVLDPRASRVVEERGIFHVVGGNFFEELFVGSEEYPDSDTPEGNPDAASQSLARGKRSSAPQDS